MPLRIGNNRIIPSPFITISKELTLNQDGTPLNSIYQITAQGTLLPQRGSPTSTAFATTDADPAAESFPLDHQKFNSILAKQELLRELVSNTGYLVAYQPSGGSAVSFYPTLSNISFAEGAWVIRSDYTINWEAHTLNRAGTPDDELNYLAGASGLNLQSVADNWTLGEVEDGSRVLQISRNTSATARRAYATGGTLGSVEPWQNARTWVTRRQSAVPFASGLSAQFNIGPTADVYNLVEEENIDQFGGSYSVSQRFIYHSNNYKENRSISRSKTYNRVGDGGSVYVENITVNGTILGYVVGNDPSGKFAAAEAYWNTIRGGLGTLVGAYGDPVSESVDEDRTNGTISYNVGFVNNSGSTYSHNYQVSYSVGSNATPSVSIGGTIQGITTDDFYLSDDGENKFGNAVTGWNTVSPTLKALAFAYTTLFGNGSDFNSSPANRTLTFDKPNGLINYNYTFNYGPSTSGYTHEYQMEFTTDNAPTAAAGGLLCSATINGQILGLVPSGDLTNYTQRFTNAKDAWAGLQSSIFTLVNDQYGVIGTNKPALSSGAVRKTVALNPQGGTVNYSVTFNNGPGTSDSRVAVEDVTVEDVYPTDIFAVQIIPGRAAGPIIQDIGTTSERRRNINIALTMYPDTSNPYTWAYADKPDILAIASGIYSSLVPGGVWYIAGMTDNWNWRNGFYTLNLSIVY